MRKPLTIDEVLKYNVSYPACIPVILFDRSPWQKFVAKLRRKGGN
jgi:hypothetical protein